MADRVFMGYRREGGKVGTRNHLGIIPTVFCVNEVAQRLGTLIPGAQPLLHQHGCCELQPDLDRTTRVLCGLIENPNLGACIVVSLGCEGVEGEDLMAAACKSGKPAIHVILQEAGGLANCIDQSLEPGKNLQAHVAREEREEFDASHIVMGIKCGSSDSTSGLAANPAVGVAADLVNREGGTAIFGETTELIGAAHILARRCRRPEIGQELLEIVARMEDRIRAVGIDMRGSQPTPGNIRGGLTTIEEKSLGAICKSGSMPIDGVLAYAQAASGKGLYVMDSPGKEDEVMTGLAAAGANLIVFSTGGGAPQGLPLVPVIKVASNPQKCAKMTDHIDVDASGILLGKDSVEAVGSHLFDVIVSVASGKDTSAEELGYDRTMGIWVHGPTI